MSDLATTDASLTIMGIPVTQLERMPVETIERLTALQERKEDREAERQFNAALAAFQVEMPPIVKDREESKGKYRYASYDDVMKVARPILQKHGLAVSFAQEENERAMTITCTVRHIGGHSMATPFTIPVDGPIQTREGRKVTTMAQAQGSANTYARRYCLCNALDIVVTDEDDDGHAAGSQPVETITQEQADQLRETLVSIEELESGATKRVMDWLKEEFAADELEQVPAKSFGMVKRALQKKLKSLEGGKA